MGRTEPILKCRKDYFVMYLRYHDDTLERLTQIVLLWGEMLRIKVRRILLKRVSNSHALGDSTNYCRMWRREMNPHFSNTPIQSCILGHLT